jgi:hypothetical protein
MGNITTNSGEKIALCGRFEKYISNNKLSSQYICIYTDYEGAEFSSFTQA